MMNLTLMHILTLFFWRGGADWARLGIPKLNIINMDYDNDCVIKVFKMSD